MISSMLITKYYFQMSQQCAELQSSRISAQFGCPTFEWAQCLYDHALDAAVTNYSSSMHSNHIKIIQHPITQGANPFSLSEGIYPRKTIIFIAIRLENIEIFNVLCRAVCRPEDYIRVLIEILENLKDDNYKDYILYINSIILSIPSHNFKDHFSGIWESDTTSTMCQERQYATYFRNVLKTAVKTRYDYAIRTILKNISIPNPVSHEITCILIREKSTDMILFMNNNTQVFKIPWNKKELLESAVHTNDISIVELVDKLIRE